MPWKPVAEATAVVPTAVIPPPAAGVSSRVVSDLERTAEDHEMRIAAAELELVSLDGRLDTAETDILALEAEDIALDGRLDALEAVPAPGRTARYGLGANQNAPQSAGGTLTVLDFDTELSNDDPGLYSVSGTGVVTVAEAGTYLIALGVQYTAGATNPVLTTLSGIRQGGVARTQEVYYEDVGVGGSMFFTMTGIFICAASDTIDAVLFLIGTADTPVVTSGAATHLTITKLS